MRKHIVFLIISTIIFLGAVNPENQPESKLLIEVGYPAPDIILPGVTGEELRLSDLRGNMVLLTFWASWCRPCRHENKELAGLYQKYSDKPFTQAEGFTIFSVSLDRRQQNWINAIADDGMSWNAHVSNLQGWNSLAAETYKIRAIPASFLIDSYGVIIAKNPSISEIEALLDNMTH